MMKKQCIYFQKGNCRKGTACEYLHDTTQPQMGAMPNKSENIQMNPKTTQSSPTSSKICNFFLKGSCTRTNCTFFHGYAENLQHIDIEKIHEKNIVSMCQINDKKFITAEDNLVQIWVISAEDKKKCVGQQMFENEKITKVIFSNEKAIVATQIEQMLSSKAKVHVITDKGMLSQEATLKKINDMIELDNYIFTVGDNFIEIYLINANAGTIIRSSPLSCEGDKSEICCVSFSMLRKLMFMGHKSGVISAWTPDSQSVIKIAGLSKIHDGPINKIMLKDVMIDHQMKQYVITCSSDMNLKVFNADENFSLVAFKTYEASVNDIFQTNDYENNESFVLSLGNGNIVVVDMGLNTLFTIPSFLGSINRFAINITNPYKSDMEGNFFILTDGNTINVNMWIKQGAIDGIVSQGVGQRRGFDSYRGGKGGHRGGHGDGYRGGFQDGSRGGFSQDNFRGGRPQYKRGGGGY